MAGSRSMLGMQTPFRRCRGMRQLTGRMLAADD
ncbi:hypothetical protein RBXJA2T_06155 [Rubrivivax benzoatilyticus JA2 = ATCC BAA-35]|nr:hypothetical protein RBXJA2T_06155 [Rubrivivax benzoatilyticus JA2 = ATCC BAA-35]